MTHQCTACGAAHMMLARDFTEYSPCCFEDGAWHVAYGHIEPSAADDAVRFFCDSCGEPHDVPTELK